MNNKILTSASIINQPHIYLTVGNAAGIIGFSKNAGSLSRVPYWSYMGKNGKLESLCCIIKSMLLSINNENDNRNFTVTVDNKTATLQNKKLVAGSDLFDFANKINKTLPVWFNPPPRRLRIAANNSCLFQEAA